MKICDTSNDICLNCYFTPPSEHGDVCRYVVEYYLAVYERLIKTNLTDEQKDILERFKMISI